jgi:putative membrane protein
MRFHTAVLTFFIVAGLTRAFAADSPDADFVRDAAKGGRHEVEIGKLADQKATSQDTKMFAKHLIDDHSKMNEELTTLAQKLGIALPDAQKDEKEMMDMLNSKSGMAFDRAFANMALEHHKSDVAAFENEAKNGKDEQVKGFAAKNLEGLRMHLKMAQDLNDKLSKGADLNDPNAEAAQNVSVSNEVKAETVPIDYNDNPAVTQPAEPAPAPAVRDIEREPINSSDNVVNSSVKTSEDIVSAPLNTAGEAVRNPVDTSVNVAGNTVNKAVDIATHPIDTAKNAITHPIDTAKNIVTAPFKSNKEVSREDREYREYRDSLRNDGFRDDGYRSENVSYERTYVNDSVECGSCSAKHERCHACGEFVEPVYDNDYRATQTSIIEHGGGCDDCR